MTNGMESLNKDNPHDLPETHNSSALPPEILAGVALIVVVAFLAYFPSLNGGFIWDDNDLLTANKIIKAPDGLYRFWFTTEAAEYHPITNTMLWIEWRLWGMNSTGYHVVSLILHIVESLLIWVILRKLSIPGAFLAAIIFAVHPVNVESAAWIFQRKNMMAMLFFLLSILCYLEFIKHAPRPTFGWRPVAAKQTPSTDHCLQSTYSSFILHPSSFYLWYWLSFLLFVMGMLSKGSVAVLPVIILGIIWWQREKKGTGTSLRSEPVPFWQRTSGDEKKGTGTSLRSEPVPFWQRTSEKKGTGTSLHSEPVPFFSRDLVRMAPFFLVDVLLVWVHIWFQTHGGGGVIRSAGFAERLLGAGGVVWFYLYKALLPINLVFIYPQWRVEAGNILWWLPLSACAAVTAVLWLYRGSWGRPLLFAWGFFCVALVPVLGLTDVYFMKFSLVADHYQHVAIIGVIALAAALWGQWHERAQGPGRMAANTLAAIAVGALVLLTCQQSSIYRNEITLYRATIKKNPDCWLAQISLGYALAQTGQIQGAIEHFRQAVRIRPDDAEAYYDLGLAMGNTGKLQEAIEYYQQALRLKPDYFEAHNNLGLVLVQTGRPEEAIEHYRQALRLMPEVAKIHHNLGVVLANTGRLEEAIEQFQEALRLKPDYAEVYVNLMLSYSQTNQPAEAISTARKAIDLARSQGRTIEVKQIEDWLKSYRAGVSDVLNASPAGQSGNQPP